MGAILYIKVSDKVSTGFKTALLLLHPHMINWLQMWLYKGFLLLSSSKWASAKNWIQGWTGPQAGSCGTHSAMPNPQPCAALSVSYLYGCFPSLLPGSLAQMLGNTWHRNTSHFHSWIALLLCQNCWYQFVCYLILQYWVPNSEPHPF